MGLGSSLLKSCSPGVGKVKDNGWVHGQEVDSTGGGVDKCCSAICHHAITYEVLTKKQHKIKLEHCKSYSHPLAFMTVNLDPPTLQ